MTLIKKPELKIIYEKVIEKENNNEIRLEEGSKFEVLPSIDEKQRDSVFIFGGSQSGKSYWTKLFIENFNRIHEGKRAVYLFSELESDETLDELKYIQRVDIESLLTDPIDINKDTMFHNSLLIFDDYDKLDDSKNHNLFSATQSLIDKVLIFGRHFNISICVLSHFGSNGNKSKTINMECQKYVIFPYGSSQHNIEYLLHKHIGVQKKDIKNIRDLGSRWLCYSKIFPPYMIGENIAKIL